MDILVIGGTRYFGIPMIKRLIDNNHNVTIATRGITDDEFGDKINRIVVSDIYNEKAAKLALYGKAYDVVIDKMCYGAADVRNILDNVKCDKYIHMSTAGVYESLNKLDIQESDFDSTQGEYVWCHRGEIPYDDAKRTAERALTQYYSEINSVSVRSPFVLGKNDYTGRFRYYIEHIVNEKPMYIDNLDERICFANATETGKFLAYLVEVDAEGAYNCCSTGTISIKEILSYIEQRTGKKSLLDETASYDKNKIAPYNGTKTNSLNTQKAQKLGFKFSDVHDWIYELIDYELEKGKI